MRTSPLDGLVIRTSTILDRSTGYIYACDLALEANEVAHAIPFRWKAGVFTRGTCNYDANSVCVIYDPTPGLVDISGAGYYSAVTAKGSFGGDIVDCSLPPADVPRIGGFRGVFDIKGKAHAIGLRGMVYRLDSLKDWTRLDNGLPETFDIQAIHGFALNDLYAVGRRGEMWHFDGAQWAPQELPTSLTLYAVKCAADGFVYAAGQAGILLRGRLSTWSVLDQKESVDDIWDLEWFGDQIYAATAENLYQLRGGTLEAVAFGLDAPISCYQLSSADGVLWSSGEHDILAFDGKKWSRIV